MSKVFEALAALAAVATCAGSASFDFDYTRSRRHGMGTEPKPPNDWIQHMSADGLMSLKIRLLSPSKESVF